MEVCFSINPVFGLSPQNVQSAIYIMMISLGVSGRTARTFFHMTKVSKSVVYVSLRKQQSSNYHRRVTTSSPNRDKGEQFA